MNSNSNLDVKVTISLPTWVEDIVPLGSKISSELQRMEIAIALSAEQVERGSGGPFGAIVCDRESGEVVGRGVNLVLPTGLSFLHAEAVAWSNAQNRLGTYDLAGLPNRSFAMYSSAQMCVGCWGGIFWTGISRVVSACTGEDVEAIVGFDEGPIPEDWVARLASRGISWEQSELRDKAISALKRYVEVGGKVYNSARGGQ